MGAQGRGKDDEAGRKNNMKNHSPDPTREMLIQPEIDLGDGN